MKFLDIQFKSTSFLNVNYIFFLNLNYKIQINWYHSVLIYFFCTFYSDFQGNDEALQGTRGQPVGADVETNEKVKKNKKIYTSLNKIAKS